MPCRRIMLWLLNIPSGLIATASNESHELTYVDIDTFLANF